MGLQKIINFFFPMLFFSFNFNTVDAWNNFKQWFTSRSKPAKKWYQRFSKRKELNHNQRSQKLHLLFRSELCYVHHPHFCNRTEIYLKYKSIEKKNANKIEIWIESFLTNNRKNRKIKNISNEGNQCLVFLWSCAATAQFIIFLDSDSSKDAPAHSIAVVEQLKWTSTLSTFRAPIGSERLHEQRYGSCVQCG